MKFHESHFEEYITSVQKESLHPKIDDKILKKFPNKVQDLKNLIFYGPSGVGKYSLMLKSIKTYSPTELKYEKKLSVTYNKEQYYFKISDIHYEVDLSMLGCNSKLLWHEIYMQIVDIISAKTNKIGIIVCKYFQDIHSELLENFYSYMQKNYYLSIDLKYILITEHLSFIPDNIINCCEIIQVARPSKINYNKCLKNKLQTTFKLQDISNIKNMKSNTNENLMKPYKIICNKVIDVIINIENYQLLKIRDLLYDLFIYNLNIDECIWYIIFTLVTNGSISQVNISKLMIKTYTFFQYYNNNYRPIYHLENYILFLSSLVNINT
jgi:hypothetical protein